MSKHADIVPLGDMLDYGRRVVAKVTDISRSAFDADDNLQLATTHLLQIIGEAAGRVSVAARIDHPDIDWPKIVGMRNRIVHDYRRIDLAVVWETATLDIPKLVLALEAFMPSDPP
jgi:uncharacterized protein with HEPN domain